MATTPRKPGLLFVAKFFAGLIVFYTLTALGPVNDYVIVPFTQFVVDSCLFILQTLRQPSDVVGTVIRSPRFALDVRNGCNGIEAFMVLAAAVLAFPATFRSRLAGILAGIVAIHLLNLVRVTSLVWLGEHHRRLFDFIHVGVWQSIIILAAVSMFVFWSWKFAEKPLVARA